MLFRCRYCGTVCEYPRSDLPYRGPCPNCNEHVEFTFDGAVRLPIPRRRPATRTARGPSSSGVPVKLAAALGGLGCFAVFVIVVIIMFPSGSGSRSSPSAGGAAVDDGKLARIQDELNDLGVGRWDGQWIGYENGNLVIKIQLKPWDDLIAQGLRSGNSKNPRVVSEAGQRTYAEECIRLVRQENIRVGCTIQVYFEGRLESSYFGR